MAKGRPVWWLAVIPLLGGCGMRQLIYPAPLLPVGVPPPGMSEVHLEMPGAHSIVGWHRPSADDVAGRPTLLFFHGNGENLETLRLSGTLDELSNLGVEILVIDYPGYGRSGGVPSEASLREGARAALEWLHEGSVQRPVVIAGWSLGAAVAIDLAARARSSCSGLIVLSGWTSLQDVARLHFPAWLVGLALRERYDSLSSSGGVACRSLVIHGSRDEIIPVEQGRRLAAGLPAATWLEVPQAGHNDLLGFSEVWERIDRFLAEFPAASPV